MSGEARRAGEAADARTPNAGVWWIDELGRWNLLDPRSPHAHERGSIPDSVFCNDLMYRFYGMLKVEIGQQGVLLSWDVKHARDRALDAALDFVRNARARVTLRFYFGGWDQEDYRRAEEAAARLEWTRAFADVTPMTRTAVRTRPFSEITARQDAFGVLTRAFQDSGGILTPELRRFLAERHLADELVLFEPEATQGELVYAHIGGSSPIADLYGSDWVSGVIGRRYDEDPCVAGSTRALWEPYEQVVKCGEARFDHVRTLVTMEDREGTWVPYERLLHPYRLADGRAGLALLSRRTPKIAIPFMGRNAA